MIYLIGWGILYLMFFLTGLAGNRTRLFIAISLIVFMVFSVMRGAVGTDTANYELIVEGFSADYVWGGMEPGFVLLGKALLSVSDSGVIAVRVLSFLIFAMLFLYLGRADKNERFLLIAYILPTFVYQYSMNGLRIGLAAMLLLLATQNVRQLRYKSGMVLAVSALLFHYSSLVSLLFIWASWSRWVKTSNVLVVPFVVCALLFLLSLNGDYFLAKLLSYQDSESPNPLSGLSKVAVLLLFVAALFFSKLPNAEKTKLIVLGAGFTISFWLVSAVSYAGLRFLDLISFAFPVAILLTYSRFALNFDATMKLAFIVAGILSAASGYRNFVAEEGVGPSPFMPYHFIDFSNGG